MGGKFTIWKRQFKQTAGLSFAAGVMAQAAMVYDQVVYVDRERGADGNDGSDWAHACKTINGAQDHIYGGSSSSARGRHFAIPMRGRLTSGLAFTEAQIIDIPGIHLIGGGQIYGMGGGWDSVFVTAYATLAADTDLSGLVSNKAGLFINADDVLVTGIKFYAPDVAGAMNHIAVNDAHGGRNCCITGNVFQGDVNGAQSVDGVGLNGSETGYVGANEFYYCGNAVTLGGGGTRYASKCIVEENKIFAPAYGIRLANSSTTENLIARNSIRPKNTYGMTFVNGIYVSDTSVGNAFEENRVFHETKATAYRYGGANAREWILNYYGGSGGTLYDGT